MVYCTVCMNNNRTNKNISYFSYPKDSTRRLEWLKAVGREDLLVKFVDDKTRQQYRICEEHFLTNYIKYSKNRNVKYLYDCAIPTLNLHSKYGGRSTECETIATQGNQQSELDTQISSRKNYLLIDVCDAVESANVDETPSFCVTKEEDISNDSTPMDSNDTLDEETGYAPDMMTENEVAASESESDLGSKPINDDEFDIFCKHVACQLRSLPLPNAIKCQMFINRYLAEERLKVIYGEASQANTAIPETDTTIVKTEF